MSTNVQNAPSAPGKPAPTPPVHNHRPSGVHEARVYFAAALILSYDFAYVHGSLQLAIAISVLAFVYVYVCCAHKIHENHAAQLLISICVSVFVLQGTLAIANQVRPG